MDGVSRRLSTTERRIRVVPASGPSSRANGSLSIGGTPRVRSVDVPVPVHGDQPALVPGRLESEPGDDPLAALAVAVQEVDGYLASGRDRFAGVVVLGIGLVAEGPLPEADIPRGHVQVAALPVKLI